MKKEVFVCPHCKAPLERVGGSYFCRGVRRHCFDVAASGYVNLTLPGAAGGGDDAALISARRAFLGAGFYRPIAEKLLSLVREYAPGNTVLDAGCGEGYYSCFLAAAGYFVAGIDLSKKGITAAAKTAARENLSAEFAVAGIFELPVADGSMDAVVSLFAPVAEGEFCRVLRPGGVLITVGAGVAHLLALKKVLYDEVYENEPRADAPAHLPLCHRETLAFPMALSGKDAENLFAMTPYYYRTPQKGRERLAALTELLCGAEVDFAVYRKAGGE